jgi:hypothetical protein
MNAQTWYLVIHIFAAPGFDYDIRVPFDDHAGCASAAMKTSIALSAGIGGADAHTSVTTPRCEEVK